MGLHLPGQKKAAPKAAKNVESNSGSKMDRIRALMDLVNRKQGISESAKLHTAATIPPVDRIRTGVLTLDAVMGGGLPRGRMTQFTGEESCFKTSALLSSVQSVQSAGGVAVWVQGEEFDRDWAEQWGVDVDSLVIVPGTSDGGDKALERALTLVDSGDVDLLIVDSIQGIPTVRESETEMGSIGYGSGAPQMWGQFTRRIYAAFSRGAPTAVVWTSQMRSAVGKFSPSGDNTTGTQIHALKHAKSVDVRFKKTEVFREGKGEAPYARAFSVKADKNKTSSPNETGEFRFYFRPHDGNDWGLDYAREAAVLGQTHSTIITRSGAWYAVDGQRVAQGIDKLVDVLRDDVDMRARVIESVYERLDGKAAE